MTTQEEVKPPAGITAWWDGLISGIVGKVILLSIVPVGVYVSSSVSDFKEATDQRHEEVKDQIRELTNLVRTMSYQQNELTRHVVIIERRVLGYSTLSGANAVADGAYAGSDLSPWAYDPGVPQPIRAPLSPEPQGPDKPNKPPGDPAAIHERDRRRLGVEGVPR